MESTGVAKGCGALIGVIGVLLIFGMIWNAADGEPETVLMSGRIEVSDSKACRDPVVKIRPDGHPTQTLRFDVTSWQHGQSCVLPIVENVPVADSYRVEIPGVGVETFERTMIDTVRDDGSTVLEVRLSW